MAFHITGDPAADAVLDEHPLALVIGMQLDQQFPIEHAFRGGWKILTRFGTLETGALAAAEPEAFKALCSQTPAIHRFPGAKAAAVQKLAALVQVEYGGEPTRIWVEATSGEDLLKRLKALPAFGPQTSRIFIALLGKQLGIRPRGWKAAAGDYALKGYRSVADVTDPDSLVKVREYKQAAKAAAKASAAAATS